MIFLVIAWLSSAGKPEGDVPPVASGETQAFLSSPHFEAVKQVVDTRCAECHSAVPGYPGVNEAPKDVRLDSDAGIAQHAEQIAMEAGYSTAMPPGNVSEITPEERALIVQWFREARGS